MLKQAMSKQALAIAFGCTLAACGGSSDSPAGAGGTGNTAGLANSGGTTGTAGGAGASAAGASAAGSAGSAGSPSGGTSGSSAAGAPGTMAEVQAIFDDRCVLCHDSMKFGIPAYPQLSLTAGNANAALVNQQAHEVCGGTLVVPGNPDQSYLIHKLSGVTPCEGGRMPRAYEVGTAPPLTVEQMATLRSWISDGAKP
jgi:hypothetical protein